MSTTFPLLAGLLVAGDWDMVKGWVGMAGAGAAVGNLQTSQEGEPMGLREMLRSLFGAKASADGDDAIHIYVECERCKSKVHVRLDRRHDISLREDGGHFVRKEIMDGKCFRMMAAEITFDGAYRLQSQEIQGGRFISREEYEAETPPALPAAS
jgi:hypothetical protein